MSDAAMGFLHVGMKVHDVERATRCYAAAFGIAWEPVREYQLSHITVEGHVAPSRTQQPRPGCRIEDGGRL
jgi:hypothetical protein